MGKSAGHCRALFRKATTKNIELLFKFMITWRWQVLWNAVCFALQENCFSSLLFQTLQQWCLLQSPQGNPPFKAGVFYYRKCKKHCARTFHHVTRQNCLVQDEHRDIAETSAWGQCSTCIHTALCTWIAVNWVEMFCTTLHWEELETLTNTADIIDLLVWLSKTIKKK